MSYHDSEIRINVTIVANNVWEGIGSFDRSEAVVTYSKIMFNRYGVSSHNNASLKIHFSAISDNIDYGALGYSFISLNATYNWWGDPSGPYHPTLNPNGTGDKVSGNVLFKPWLTSLPHDIRFLNQEYAFTSIGKVCRWEWHSLGNRTCGNRRIIRSDFRTNLN